MFHTEKGAVKLDQVVKWVFERIIEILAEADECRVANSPEDAQRLADVAGGIIYEMYNSFPLDAEFLEDLEGIRGSIEATTTWRLAVVIKELRAAYNRWLHRQPIT